MKSVSQIIAEIAAIGSTLAKRKIVEDNANNKALEMTFFYTENPRFNYWIKADPKTMVGKGTREIDIDTFAGLNQLIGRVVTGNAARQFLTELVGDYTPEEGIIICRIVNKDLRCNCGTSIANKVWKDLIPEYPYMRCSLPESSNLLEITPEEWAAGVYSQLKHDGSYANVNVYSKEVDIITRSGTIYPPGSLGIDADLINTFKDQTQTHGELTVYQDGVLLERQVGNGILNSIAKGGSLEKGQTVHYDVWDQIPLSSAVPKGEYDVPYDTRFKDLIEQVSETLAENIHIGEFKFVYSNEEAQVHYKKIRQRKLEGTIIKRRSLKWKDGTSKDQFKNKASIDVEMRVKGFIAGKGQHAATFGSLIVESEDGLVQAGCSGFSKKLRQEISDNREDWLESIITVTINGMQYSTKAGKKHSVYLPRFCEARLDKSKADTLAQIEAQIEAALK